MTLNRCISTVLLLVLLACLFMDFEEEKELGYGTYDTIESNPDKVGSLKQTIDNQIFYREGELSSISTRGYDLVKAAYKELGNVGGEPYWRWYGLGERVSWCAIFVSYCADQCGYLEAGIIPNTASVPTMVRWFQARDQWLAPGNRPTPGSIIFFDFENFEAGIYWTNDGSGDHVGIVEKVAGDYVYCIEGNNGDKCKQTSYEVDSRWILGYGMPDYESLDK